MGIRQQVTCPLLAISCVIILLPGHLHLLALFRITCTIQRIPLLHFALNQLILACLADFKMADTLSSNTWRESVNSELRSKQAWMAKYGHQFAEDEDVTPGNSRPNTGRSCQGDSRPATGISNASRCSSGADETKKLMELKKKLTAALSEVDAELSQTSRSQCVSSRSRK